MRDYGETWTDFAGRVWPVIASARRLKFKNPAHAAARAHVYHRDGYRCVRCGVAAINVPRDYTGRMTLETSALCRDGVNRVLLVLDHAVTLKAGGKNRVENLQTMCETCNLQKQPEDLAATAAHLLKRPTAGPEVSHA